MEDNTNISEEQKKRGRPRKYFTQEDRMRAIQEYHLKSKEHRKEYYNSNKNYVTAKNRVVQIERCKLKLQRLEEDLESLLENLKCDD